MKDFVDRARPGYGVRLKDIEVEVLVSMHKNGLVAGRYRDIHDVRRSIGWQKMASRHRERSKFDTLARKLVKKGILTDHGKSMKVLSLTPTGDMLVREYLGNSGRKTSPDHDPGTPERE